MKLLIKSKFSDIAVILADNAFPIIKIKIRSLCMYSWSNGFICHFASRYVIKFNFAIRYLIYLIYLKKTLYKTKITYFQKTVLSQEYLWLSSSSVVRNYIWFHVPCCLNTKRILKSSFPKAIQCNQEAIFVEPRCCTLRPVATTWRTVSQPRSVHYFYLPILWHIKFVTVL